MALDTIKDLIHSDSPRSSIIARGWVRTKRDSKACSFLEITDGSCFKGLQVVVAHFDRRCRRSDGRFDRVSRRRAEVGDAGEGTAHRW
jgi:aspartyl/asparaginyl-tRNA synthetase